MLKVIVTLNDSMIKKVFYIDTNNDDNNENIKNICLKEISNLFKNQGYLIDIKDTNIITKLLVKLCAKKTYNINDVFEHNYKRGGA